MNRLSQEKSPYLLQHKDNPVDWYPWSSEAFRKAKQEDKPILLSIGYSTCHWCHVMAHESFEDEETAEVLNRDFICIKVDCEERADIDAVYMKVCQAMTGSGGWPTTIFMTPEQKPFFAGTYFPRHNRYGQPGLIELSQSIARLWKSDRESLLRYGDQIIAAITSQHNGSGEPSRELMHSAYESLCRTFDRKWGGFGPAPKFPAPHNLLFLMQYGDTQMVTTTLNAMAKGGIFDQIGGEPLDLAKTYTVACHDYMLKNCGDDFTMFKGCTVLKDMVMVDNQMLTTFIIENLGGTVGEEYSNPFGQERIIAVE